MVVKGCLTGQSATAALRFVDVETLLEYGLPALAFASLPASALWARRWRRRRDAAEWRVAIRSTPQGAVVELVRPGEHSQRIARLDPADDEFSTRLEEARHQALERAVALNVARRGLGT
jgi:hypothetical protein